MNDPMHDLLAIAVDRRTGSFAEERAFADAHKRRVVRAIRRRRAIATAGIGAVVAALVGAAGLGVTALTHTSLNLFPAGQPSPDPSMPIPSITPDAPSLATPVVTTLVPVEIDASAYPAGETSREYVFFVSLGTMEMIPFPASGIWYPGIPDVPADAMIVAVSGDTQGYDLEAPDAPLAGIQACPAWTDMYDMVGNRDAYDFQYAADGQNASINWDVIGDVTDHTRWGIHYFLLDGNVVTEVEGRANPDAIEVTAWFDPAAATAESVAVPVTTVTTTLVRVPLEDQYSTNGTTSRTYAYYSSVGAKDMISFPEGGLWYPGIPDVPADAVILVFAGGVEGFDFTGERRAGDMGIMPAWMNETNLYDYELVGDRDFYDFQWTEDGQNASIAYDVIGDVTDHTRWGIHYYLVDGEVVREVDGRGNPAAIEVTAWFDPATFTLTG